MSRTVLIVEDEADVMLAFRIVLETAGYEVAQAASGEQALTMLDTLTPDAIVLDIVLPGIDGWGVLERIRASGLAAEIPIVVASANASPAQQQRAADYGCAALFAKPFSAQEFVRTIHRLLEHDG
jgi:CheY-like chemotaxis protein